MFEEMRSELTQRRIGYWKPFEPFIRKFTEQDIGKEIVKVGLGRHNDGSYLGEIMILKSLSNKEDRSCAMCGILNNECRRCSGCRVSFYCGKQCQSLHWKSHKKICKNGLNHPFVCRAKYSNLTIYVGDITMDGSSNGWALVEDVKNVKPDTLFAIENSMDKDELTHPPSELNVLRNLNFPLRNLNFPIKSVFDGESHEKLKDLIDNVKNLTEWGIFFEDKLEQHVILQKYYLRELLFTDLCNKLIETLSIEEKDRLPAFLTQRSVPPTGSLSAVSVVTLDYTGIYPGIRHSNADFDGDIDFNGDDELDPFDEEYDPHNEVFDEELASSSIIETGANKGMSFESAPKWVQKLHKCQDKEISEEEKSCVVCFTNEKKVCALPCQHMVLCATCALELYSRQEKAIEKMKCPVCRELIDQCIEIFM